MKRSDLIANILLWLTPLLLLLPNIALDITEILYTPWEKILNIAVPGAIYILLMAWSRNTGRSTLFFIPIMVLCAFQIVLLFLYGESIIAIDMFLNVVTTNATEVTELLGNLLTAVLTVIVIYLPLIILGILGMVRGSRTSDSMRGVAVKVGCGFAVVSVIAGCVAFTQNYTPTRRLFPANVLSNIAHAAERTVETAEYHTKSADFTFNATTTRDCDSPEIYVMVIGETSRADNWSLAGYERPTNPRLSCRKSLVYFPRTLSESNTTHKSVPMLMSHLNSDRFADSIYCSKGIIEAFNEAGYSTAWISNQQHNHSLIDFFGQEAQDAEFLCDSPGVHADEELITKLKDRLDGPHKAKMFVVLHTYGSHFNYHERYPESFNVFGPEISTDASPDNRPGLINAYDNSIRYTDAVVDSVIGTLAQCNVPAALLYVSDHGEDIFDDSRNRFLHASPTPTYYQIHVPLLVWMSDSYIEQHPDKAVAAMRNSACNVSSSRSAFHTLMSMAGLTSPDYDSSAALTEDGYIEPVRQYLNDYNEAVDLRSAGLRNADFNSLAAHNISR